MIKVSRDCKKDLSILTQQKCWAEAPVLISVTTDMSPTGDLIVTACPSSKIYGKDKNLEQFCANLISSHSQSMEPIYRSVGRRSQADYL